MLGHVFNKFGALTSQLSDAPSQANLSKASVYIIVDPDTEKESRKPNYVSEKDIAAIYDYVVKGGVLLLMGNDSGNAEFAHFNKLAGRFGITFNENLRHDVKGSQFEQGAVLFSKNNLVFKTPAKGYIKQLSTLSIKKPATAIYSENNEVLISVSKIGKGTVFAVGDPCF